MEQNACRAAEQARQNREYVRRLLRQRQPRFAASLELAAWLVERELCQPVTTPRDASGSETA
jgi:hypothetical protein